MDYRTAQEKIYSIQIMDRTAESITIKNCSNKVIFDKIVDGIYRPLSMGVKGCERMIKEYE